MDSLIWITMATMCISAYGFLDSPNAGGSQLGSTQKYVIACLTEDQEEELFLNCPVGSSIYIHRAVQGKQYIADGSQQCVYLAENECSMEAPELEKMRDKCMGQPNCNTPVSKHFIDACGEPSNYVQVDYSCIPERTEDTMNIVDVCGDMTNGDTQISYSGYIKTPNYPEIYPPDVSCSCHLTTLIPNANITLTLLDLDLETSSEFDVCHWDWLEYLGVGEVWGSARKMCSLKDSAAIYEADSGRVQINFKSDSKTEKRGFWLKYEGHTQSGEPAYVRLRCGMESPVIMREAIQCFPSQETDLPLDCGEVGVIDILSARHGYRGDENKPCEYSILDPCGSDMTSDPDMMEKCMGQVSCIVQATRVPLQDCNNDSDYFQVKYQCIPVTHDRGNIIDICGANIDNEEVLRQGGYIESMNYPHHYPPITECQCHLVTDERAIVHFEVMDMEIASQSGEPPCDSDMLEYTVNPEKTGVGTKLCQTTVGDIINTTSKDIYLNFMSNGVTEDRGFWIKYFGVRQDGSHVPVRVQCNTLQALHEQKPDNKPDIIKDIPKPGKPNIGLIIGLAAIAALMVILLIAMLIYRMRKSNLKTTEMTNSTISTIPVPAEKSYTSLQHQASSQQRGLDQHYAGLEKSGKSYDLQHRNESSRKNDAYTDYIENNPDYDQEPSYSTNLPTSYINPAYDSTAPKATYGDEVHQETYDVRI